MMNNLPDPWIRQYKMLRLSMCSTTVLVSFIIVMKLGFDHKTTLALIITPIWIVADSIFIFFFLRAVRNRHQLQSSGTGFSGPSREQP
jgi:hypothetical protein